MGKKKDLRGERATERNRRAHGRTGRTGSGSGALIWPAMFWPTWPPLYGYLQGRGQGRGGGGWQGWGRLAGAGAVGRDGGGWQGRGAVGMPGRLACMGLMRGRVLMWEMVLVHTVWTRYGCGG